MKKIIIAALLAITTATAPAQVNRTQALINAALKGWDIELRMGYNLGGTSPMPLPEEIRKIDSYSPGLPLSLEANFIKRFDTYKKWGLLFGVKVETKAMETKATVKNYGMEIIGDDGSRVAGRWTGGVQTNVENYYLTFPVLGTYRVHPRTNIKAGVFMSYVMRRKFNGYVYEGYLRNGDPTGEKTSFTDGQTASYDFSDNLRRFQWGAQVGVDWQAFKHLKLYADLTWGLNDIFKNDFKTITFSMYPIYVNLGVGYAF